MTGAMPVTAAEQLAIAADQSCRIRTIEADLRADLFLVLAPYALNVLGLDPSDVRQEGTGSAGRFDSLFGRAVIEYKRPGLLQSAVEREHAAEQAIGYLEAPDIGAQVVIVTDGAIWGVLRDVEAGPEIGEQGWLDLGLDLRTASPADRFSWRQNSSDTAQRVITLLSTVRSAPVTSVSVNSRLGLTRPEVRRLVEILAARLTGRRDDSRADVLYRQWLQLAGVAYGIASNETPWPARARQLPEEWAALRNLTYGEAVFTLHTYITLASKLLACELLALTEGRSDVRPTQWVDLRSGELVRRLDELERGVLTDQLGAPGLLAGDLFGWYVDSLRTDREFIDAIHGLLRSMAELAWPRVATAGGVAVDLLRELYQAVVPASFRIALGEFFTPRYIAERVFQQAVVLLRERRQGQDSTAPLRVLDPSCGSGTFLVAAMRLGLARLSQTGRGDDPDSLAELVDSLAGFDINPVSSVMTKVNLLMALGDRAHVLPELRFNIFQADSILLPELVAGQLELRKSADTLRIPLEIGAVDLPSSMAQLAKIALLRQQIETSIEAVRAPERFRQRLRTELARLSTSEDLPAELDAAVVLYVRLAQLAAEGRNGVWARVIEQAFAPRLVEPFDIVVGNPPWISWKNLPPGWKARSELVWRSWDMWLRRRGGGGIPLSDISTLLVSRALANYVRADGVVAMLLPQSVLIADPSGRAFRRCLLRSDETGGEFALEFCPLQVDDFTKLNPFSPDASNLPIGLYLAPRMRARFPIPHFVWRRARARSRLNAHAAWSEMKDVLELERADLLPVDRRDSSSPWGAPMPEGGLVLRSDLAAIPYTFGRGFETRGLDGVFFCEVESDRPASGGVRIRTRPDLGDNTRHLEPMTAVVDAALLWPLVKGAEVSRWRVQRAGLYCIVPYDPGNLSRCLSVNEMIERFPRTYDFFERIMDLLTARSLYQASADPERPWVLSGPPHLRSDGALVMARYIAGRGRPGAAVAVPSMDARLGRETLVFPNNKTNVLYLDAADEAMFVAAWINSSPAQDALGRFAASTGITPKALHRLPIPRYSRTDPDHAELVMLAREATRLAGLTGEGELGALVQAEMDRLVSVVARTET